MLAEYMDISNNNSNDYSLLSTSNQTFDQIDNINYSNKDLTNKLLNDINLSLNDELNTKTKSLYKVIKLNLINKNCNPSLASNIATSAINNIVKIMGRPRKCDKLRKISKEISDKAKRHARAIIKENIRELKLEGKTSHSATKIAKNDLHLIIKEIKKSLREKAGKTPLDSVSIERQVSREIDNIKREIKSTLINQQNRRDKSASDIASKQANEQREQILQSLRIENNKLAITSTQTDIDNKINLATDILKNTLIKNNVSPTKATKIAEQNINSIQKTILTPTNISNLSNKEIERLAEKESKIIKKEMKTILNKIDTPPKIAEEISTAKSNEAKVFLEQKLKLIDNRLNPDTPLVNVSPNMPKLEPIMTAVKTNAKLKKKSNTTLAKDIAIVNKSIKKIENILNAKNITVNATFNNYTFNTMNNVVDNIQPTVIAKKLASSKYNINMELNRKQRELIILVIISAIKNMILQILSTNSVLTPEQKNFIDKLVNLLNNEDQLLLLISKVSSDEKFLKILNIQNNNIETFKEHLTSQQKIKKAKEALAKAKKNVDLAVKAAKKLVDELNTAKKLAKEANTKVKKAARKLLEANNKVVSKSSTGTKNAIKEAKETAKKAENELETAKKKAKEANTKVNNKNKQVKNAQKAVNKAKQVEATKKAELVALEAVKENFTNIETYNNPLVNLSNNKLSQLMDIINNNILETFNKPIVEIENNNKHTILFYILAFAVVYYIYIKMKR